MSCTEEIYTACSAMLGTLSDRESAALRAACAMAEAEVMARLRRDVDDGTHGTEFINACGMLALSRFLLLAGAGSGAESVRLGSMTVSLRSADSVREAASTLRGQAEAALSAWLEDGGFCFMGVRG